MARHLVYWLFTLCKGDCVFRVDCVDPLDLIDNELMYV